MFRAEGIPKRVLEDDPVVKFLGSFERKHIRLAVEFKKKEQLALLQAMKNVPGMYELLRDIPILGYVLTFNHQLVQKYKAIHVRTKAQSEWYHDAEVKCVKPHRRMANIKRLIKKKRLLIARDLGLAETKGQLNRLKRIGPKSCHDLAHAPGTKDMLLQSQDKRLSHIKLGKRVGELCNRQYQDDLALVHQDLLEEVTRKENMINRRGKPQRTAQQQFTNLRDTLQMIRQLKQAADANKVRCPVSLRPMRTMEEVRERHDACLPHVNNRGGLYGWNEFETFTFPEPPIPGTDEIKPILTDKELRAEGERMHHCVGGYARQVAAGSCFIYHVEHKGDKGTLEIRKSAPFAPYGIPMDEKWQAAQFHGPCNRPVSKEMRELVNNWLKEANNKEEK